MKLKIVVCWAIALGHPIFSMEKNMVIKAHDNPSALMESNQETLLNEANQGIVSAIFAYSRKLFDSNKINEAMFWYCVGIIRTRQDISCCLNPTSENAIKMMKYEMIPYIKKHKEKVDLLTPSKFKEAVLFLETKNQCALPAPHWVADYGDTAIVKSVYGMANRHEFLSEHEWELQREAVIENFKIKLEI